MSFIQQLNTITGYAPLSRRKALLGLSLLTLTACSRSAQQAKGASSNVAYYTCTMHPFVRSQDPQGKCPICGMDLVPVMVSATTSADFNDSVFHPGPWLHPFARRSTANPTQSV